MGRWLVCFPPAVLVEHLLRCLSSSEVGRVDFEPVGLRLLDVSSCTEADCLGLLE